MRGINTRLKLTLNARSHKFQILKATANTLNAFGIKIFDKKYIYLKLLLSLSVDNKCLSWQSLNFPPTLCSGTPIPTFHLETCSITGSYICFVYDIFVSNLVNVHISVGRSERVVEIQMDPDAVEESTEDAFRDAVRAGEMAVVSEFVLRIKEKGNHTLKALLDSRDGQSGNTALHFSSANGHIDAIKFLLSNGASTDIKNASGSTALHYAALTGQLEAVQSLLKGGASPVIENDFGRTALDDAQSARQTEVVKFLIQHVESNATAQGIEEGKSEKGCQ